jgi:hypothetical protein
MTTKEPQTEQEWAEFYQAHKDDPELWEEPEPAPRGRRPGRPSQGMTETITVRFTPAEAEIIRQAAAAEEGMTFSEAVRRAVRAYAPATKANTKPA